VCVCVCVCVCAPPTTTNVKGVVIAWFVHRVGNVYNRCPALLNKGSPCVNVWRLQMSVCNQEGGNVRSGQPRTTRVSPSAVAAVLFGYNVVNRRHVCSQVTNVCSKGTGRVTSNN